MDKNKVKERFDNIAETYDKLNHILSFNIDKRWRKKALQNKIHNKNIELVIDIACGTGDTAILVAQKGVERVIGVDISSEMIKIAQLKAEKLKLNNISFNLDNANNLSDYYNSADMVTCTFGVRNFEYLLEGISEIYKVLKPGGSLVILELTKPQKFPMKQLFTLYAKYFIPNIGLSISGNKAAYNYLVDSIYQFPQGEDFLYYLRKMEFIECCFESYTAGICTCYTAKKAV